MEWELCLLRLLMAPRIAAGPPFLLALIRGAGGNPWRTALRWSLKALHLMLPGKFEEMECPLANAEAWERLWTANR